MKNTAVIVVHGVGDPLPGDAMEGLVQGLSASGWREAGPRHIEHSHEPNLPLLGSPLVPTFPVPSTSVRRQASGDELHLREVYWGDLSRVRGSATALLLAVFDLIFGLRHFVHAAADDAAHQLTSRCWAVRSSLSAAAFCCDTALKVTRGPMVAFNLMAATTCLLFVVMQWLPYSSDHDPLKATLGAVAVLALFGAWLHHNARQLQLAPETAISLMLTALVTLPLAFGASWSGPPYSIASVIERITAAMSVGALAMGSLGLIAIVLLVLTPCLLRERKGRCLLRRAMTAMTFPTLLSIGLFTLLALLGWIACIELLQDGFDANHRATELARRIECGIHLFPLVALTFFLVGLCYVPIHLANRKRMHCRYIVNTWVVVIYLGAAFITGVLFFFLVNMLEQANSCELPTPGTQFETWVITIVAAIENNKALFLTSGAALIAVLAAFRSHLLSSLDLVLDVLTHFRVDESGPGPEAVRRQWMRTLARFRVVVEQTLRDTGAERLIIVSHSQGTTISLQGLGLLDVAGDPRQSPIKRIDLELGLITMGCPLDHLYRHYFPERYALRSETEVRADWWHNIHRADDFIGTDVKGLDATYPVNTSVGPHGHTDYWRDAEVLRHIIERIDGSAPTKQAPPGPLSPVTP